MNTDVFAVLNVKYNVKYLTFLLWITLSIPIFPHPVRSQTVTFEPRNKGSVDDSRGTASRSTLSNCQSDERVEIGLTPVVPRSSFGLTLSEHPTFYVYIPSTSATYAQFTLKDQNNRGIYQTTLPLHGMTGIVAFSLPDSISLEMGKMYSWFVGLICDPVQTDFPWVQGHVERIAPQDLPVIDQQPKTLLEQAVMYGREGLWYDTVHSLAQDRKTQPNNSILGLNWINLLNSVGLDEISDQSFLSEL